MQQDDKDEMTKVQKATANWGEDGRPIVQSGIIDVNPQEHLEQADAEMAAQIEGHILLRLQEENDKMKTWLEDRFGDFQKQTESQL